MVFCLELEKLKAGLHHPFTEQGRDSQTTEKRLKYSIRAQKRHKLVIPRDMGKEVTSYNCHNIHVGILLVDIGCLSGNRQIVLQCIIYNKRI